MGVVANLVVKVTADVKDVDKQFAALGPSLGGADKAALSLSASIGKVAAAIGLVGIADKAVTTLANWTKEAIANAGALVDMSAKTGLSTETLQRMGYVGKQTGVELNQLTDAAFMLGVRIQQGKGNIDGLGLSFHQLRQMSPDQQFEKVVDALSRMEDPQKRNAMAVELFGRSARSILPAIADDYDRIADQANIASDAQIKAIDRASDAWDAFIERRKSDITQTLGSMVLAGEQGGAMGMLQMLGATLHGGGLSSALTEGLGKNVPKDIILPDPNKGKTVGTTGSTSSGGSRPSAPARVNQFLGADLFKRADEAMKDLAQIGGLTKLTEEETRRLNRTLGDALEKYVALSRVGPKAMYETWLATSLPTVGSGIAGIGQQLALPTAPLPPVPGLPMGGGLSGIGQSLALPTAPAPPGFLESAFGGMKDFGTNLSGIIMQSLTGGGDLGKSLGGFLGGNLLGQLGGKLAGSLGGALGGIVGNIFGPLGSMLGSMLGGLVSKIGGAVAKLFGRGDDGDKERDAFLSSMGGFNDLAKKLNVAFGAEGDKMFAALRNADSGKEVTAAADKIKEALENHAKAIEGITAGVNARSKNITGQADLDVVGAGATAAFALMIQQGMSAIEAFNALTPAITAMKDALAAGNLTASESVARLLEVGAVLDANKVQFDNIAASGQILSAMLAGNIKDVGLFAAVAGDIGTQIQAVIDKGVPMAQVFALAQPQLQAIWEAQKKWGFAVDETTAALLAEAEAQGFVGEHMRSVNEQILSVLVAIANVLGADIPAALAGLPGAAQAAATGMQNAFDTVRPPGTGGWTPGEPVQAVPYGPNGGGDVYLDGERVGRVMLPIIAEESQRLGVS
jgi:hypothetical protein